MGSANKVRSDERQLTLDEVVQKYADVPRLNIIKTDVQRRGVYYTQQALDVLDEKKHQVTGTHIFGARDGRVLARPESLILPDGSSIITTPTPLEQNPYVVDVVKGRIALVDNDEFIEEVDYWPRPDFYALRTASGQAMKYIVSARPKRLSIFPYRYCQFWNSGDGCLFCDIVPQLKQGKSELGVPARLDPEDVAQAIGEALKEPGRFTGITLTGGSIIAGAEAFDDEVEYYIKVLQAIGRNFRTERFNSQLISTAFTRKQLQRLHDETGLSSFTADIEVLDEGMFNWLCPGKAKWIGYQEWKRRLVHAAGVFGRGMVNTGIVAGVELAEPHGFTNEDEALQATLEEAEDLAQHGVSTVYIVWSPRPNSALGVQENASLEYFVRLTQGLHGLRVKYGLPIEHDDFRNCGNHPDSDLSRVPESISVSDRKPVVLGDPELLKALSDPATTRIIATSDKHGTPLATMTPWVGEDTEGLFYLEPLQGSRTNANLTHSLWFNRAVSLTISTPTGKTWHIIGRPKKAHVCGPVFRRYYELVQRQDPGSDLAAAWEIEPLEITRELQKTRQAEHDAHHPSFIHLDRLRSERP